METKQIERTIPYIEKELVSLIGTNTKGSRAETIEKQRLFTELLKDWFNANQSIKAITINYIKTNWYDAQEKPYNNTEKLALFKLLRGCELLAVTREEYVEVKPNNTNDGYIVEKIERRNGFIALKLDTNEKV